jgi:hypothetical protein
MTDGLPRHSSRVVAQGEHRVSNLEVQEQNVLMRKWQITLVQRSPDVDALLEYNSIFPSPLGSSSRKAIQTLFTFACPQASVMAIEVDP